MKKKATSSASEKKTLGSKRQMKFEKNTGEKQYNPPIPFKVKPQLPEKVIRGGSSRKTVQRKKDDMKGKC
jgi:hypothetical protein